MNTRRRATTSLPSCWTATPHRDEQAERCSSHSAQRPRGGADGVIQDGERRNEMQKITPFLWFDGKAEEAMNSYVSVFKNSKVVRVSRYGAAGQDRRGPSCPRHSNSMDKTSSR